MEENEFLASKKALAEQIEQAPSEMLKELVKNATSYMDAESAFQRFLGRESEKLKIRQKIKTKRERILAQYVRSLCRRELSKRGIRFSNLRYCRICDTLRLFDCDDLCEYCGEKEVTEAEARSIRLIFKGTSGGHNDCLTEQEARYRSMTEEERANFNHYDCRYDCKIDGKTATAIARYLGHRYRIDFILVRQKLGDALLHVIFFEYEDKMQTRQYRQIKGIKISKEVCQKLLRLPNRITTNERYANFELKEDVDKWTDCLLP